MKSKRRKITSTERIALTGVVGVTTLALLGFGASASFTNTASDEQRVDAGTTALSIGTAGDATTNRLVVDAIDVAPGDTIERSFDLISSGSIDLQGLTMEVSAIESSDLDTDAVNGLQFTLQECSIPWTETTLSASPEIYTYSCGGSVTTHVADVPVIQAQSPLDVVAPIETAGTTAHLMSILTLPTTADNDFQGDSTLLEYEFTAIQRDATSR